MRSFVTYLPDLVAAELYNPPQRPASGIKENYLVSHHVLCKEADMTGLTGQNLPSAQTIPGNKVGGGGNLLYNYP